MGKDGEFEPGPGWADKTGFVPGMPDDTSGLPSLYYQALMGRVFTLMRWPDGSTVRGEAALADLEDLVGTGRVREGWYSASGTYLGAELDLD